MSRRFCSVINTWRKKIAIIQSVAKLLTTYDVECFDYSMDVDAADIEEPQPNWFSLMPTGLVQFELSATLIKRKKEHKPDLTKVFKKGKTNVEPRG